MCDTVYMCVCIIIKEMSGGAEENLERQAVAEVRLTDEVVMVGILNQQLQSISVIRRRTPITVIQPDRDDKSIPCLCECCVTITLLSVVAYLIWKLFF